MCYTEQAETELHKKVEREMTQSVMHSTKNIKHRDYILGIFHAQGTTGMCHIHAESEDWITEKSRG